MKSRPSLPRLALALTLAVGLSLTLREQSLADTLPQLEADSLSGTHVVLPRDAAGKPLVLLLAYTKDSQSELKAWSRKLLDDHVVDKATVYVVVVADKTVFFARNGVRKTVEGAAVGSSNQKNSNVLITFNGAGWRGLVPPGDKKTIGVVVCDTNGRIVYAKREPFTIENVSSIEKALRESA